MERYYKKINGKTEISNVKKTGWNKIDFIDKQDFMNGGNPGNIIWDKAVPRIKTEAEMVAVAIESKKTQLSQAIQGYIWSKYDGGEQASLLALDNRGNNAQKSACGEIWAWIFGDVQKGDYVKRKEVLLKAVTFAELDAISMDFSNNDATKPPYTYLDVMIMT